MVTARQANIKAQIDKTRQSIGREISIFTPTRVACSICSAGGFYDSISDSSVYIKCPQCQGRYWLDILSETKVLARVHWTTNEAAEMTPGGRYYTGDAYAVIDPEYHTLAQEAQNPGGKVTIDGQDLTIVRITPEGVPIINRLKLILQGTGKRPTA